MEAINSRNGLIRAAEEAGIEVPRNIYTFSRKEFPYWALFADCQIDRPLQNNKSHYKNAIAVAGIPKEDIQDMKYGDVQDLLE